MYGYDKTCLSCGNEEEQWRLGDETIPRMTAMSEDVILSFRLFLQKLFMLADMQW